MKSNKQHRFEQNPKEEEFHNKFIEMFADTRVSNYALSSIVHGWANDGQNYPKEYLSEKEEDICINLIQWLGSPVGQGFLESCGFINNTKTK